MTKKKPTLTTRETKLLNDARDFYIKALEKYQNNPSDFDCIIKTLKSLAEATHLMITPMIKHLHNKIEAQLKASTARFKFFRNHAYDKMLKEQEIINDATNMFRDLDGKNYFDKESRITGLYYFENRPSPTVIKEEYKISFSDGSIIKLDNLSDETIKNTRVKFMEKMNELAAQNQIKLNP